MTGYETLIDAITLPDPDDRHVLAAAIREIATRLILHGRLGPSEPGHFKRIKPRQLLQLLVRLPLVLEPEFDRIALWHVSELGSHAREKPPPLTGGDRRQTHAVPPTLWCRTAGTLRATGPVPTSRRPRVLQERVKREELNGSAATASKNSAGRRPATRPRLSLRQFVSHPVPQQELVAHAILSERHVGLVDFGIQPPERGLAVPRIRSECQSGSWHAPRTWRPPWNWMNPLICRSSRARLAGRRANKSPSVIGGPVNVTCSSCIAVSTVPTKRKAHPR